MIKLLFLISEMRKITLQIRLFMILYVSLDVLGNPTCDPNSVSNILNCTTLPDFLTENDSENPVA